jgi:DNA invertase Pin-like site-specific DNA recombinase
MIRQILGAVAEYVRAQTVARLRAGKRRKREAGGYIGGQPAFGQAAVEKALVDDEAERATIRRILELEQDGLSLRQMAAVLEIEGRVAKRGGRWHPQTVARVLDRARSTATA